MLRSKRLLVVAALTALTCTGLAASLAWLIPDRPQDLVISTGTEGGTYILIGEQLARVLQAYPRAEIGTVEARPSAGSLENIERLSEGTADVALVVGPVLAADPRRSDIRVVMSLYSDVWQVVVNRAAGIADLADLRGKRIYVGADDSGTQWGATRILGAAGIADGDYTRVAVRSYQEAANALQAGTADAAFFITATPAEAVAATLSSGCCALLDLDRHSDAIRAQVPGLDVQTIGRQTYENQLEAVQTLGGPALLIARANLADAVVVAFLDALFDNISELAAAHIRVQDIRLERAFPALPAGLELHAGAVKFQDQQKRTLLIATGAIDGKYFELGKQMQLVLEQSGFDARAIHTDGSLENIELLNANEWPAVAIVQYDIALASLWSPDLYHAAELTEIRNIPHIQGLRRIVSLHEEKVHVAMRRELLPEGIGVPTLEALQDARVSIGPDKSGTQIIARALLSHAGVVPRAQLLLSVPDMVERLHSRDIDAGFFVSHAPTDLLMTLLDDDNLQLLSIEPSTISGLVGPALSVSEIPAGTYPVQRDGSPAVSTISTRAVLVTAQELPFSVGGITQALFEGVDFLGVDGGRDAMALELASLPLHPDAARYYREAGYLPSDNVDWLGTAYLSLATLAILVGAYTGLLRIRRDRTSNEIVRRILGISLHADEPESVRKLVQIRTGELKDRARRRWWQVGELDKTRWQYLYQLINERIATARENLTRAMAAEIRSISGQTHLDADERLTQLRSLKERAWSRFANGELDAAQENMLLEEIQTVIDQLSEPTRH